MSPRWWNLVYFAFHAVKWRATGRKKLDERRSEIPTANRIFHNLSVKGSRNSCNRANWCFAPVMEVDFQEKARWLARHVLPYEPLLRARLRRMFMQGIEVDDVIQEMYARLVSQPSLESIKYPRQYAARTATAIVIDHLRRSRVISINAAGSLEQLEISAPEVSPEQQLEFREEIAAVAQFLAMQPERTREVLIMRRVEGLSQQQTADRLGISTKTVEKHMAQGVAALMELFGRGGKPHSHPSTSKRSNEHVYKILPAGD